jgi:hypothetical protein
LNSLTTRNARSRARRFRKFCMKTSAIQSSHCPSSASTSQTLRVKSAPDIREAALVKDAQAATIQDAPPLSVLEDQNFTISPHAL